MHKYTYMSKTILKSDASVKKSLVGNNLACQADRGGYRQQIPCATV